MKVKQEFFQLCSGGKRRMPTHLAAMIEKINKALHSKAASKMLDDLGLHGASFSNVILQGSQKDNTGNKKYSEFPRNDIDGIVTVDGVWRWININYDDDNNVALANAIDNSLRTDDDSYSYLSSDYDLSEDILKQKITRIRNKLPSLLESEISHIKVENHSRVLKIIVNEDNKKDYFIELALGNELLLQSNAVELNNKFENIKDLKNKNMIYKADKKYYLCGYELYRKAYNECSFANFSNFNYYFFKKFESRCNGYLSMYVRGFKNFIGLYNDKIRKNDMIKISSTKLISLLWIMNSEILAEVPSNENAIILAKEISDFINEENIEDYLEINRIFNFDIEINEEQFVTNVQRLVDAIEESYGK